MFEVKSENLRGCNRDRDRDRDWNCIPTVVSLRVAMYTKYLQIVWSSSVLSTTARKVSIMLCGNHNESLVQSQPCPIIQYSRTCLPIIWYIGGILVLSFHCDTRKKCNMRSYTPRDVLQPKQGGMFRLVKFQPSDEAEQLYGALMRCRRPNLAHVLQFTVEGEGGCPSSISEWKELAVVVKAINENTNYEANMEMNIFIKYLESENAKCIMNLIMSIHKMMRT
ncbi:hypothetical protein ACSBR2_035579 [Camellia fascicularis]